jgi:hypothetical protein
MPDFRVKVVEFLWLKPNDRGRHKKDKQAFNNGKSNNGTQNDQEEISDGRSTVANCRSNDGWMTITHRLQGLKVSEHFLSG